MPRHTLLLLAALYNEIASTFDRLGLRREGRIFTTPAVTHTPLVGAVTGLGAARAITATRHLLDQHRPYGVILLGFAGGLDPALKPATLVPIAWVLDEHGSTIDLDGQRNPSSTRAQLPIAPQPVGDDPNRDPGQSLITVERLARTATDKKRLWDRHGCAAVDMETFAIAKLLADQRVPMWVLRAILDPADACLPRPVTDWVKPDGHADTAAAVRHLLTHPWRIPAMLRVHKTARLAANRLADGVESIVAALSEVTT